MEREVAWPGARRGRDVRRAIGGQRACTGVEAELGDVVGAQAGDEDELVRGIDRHHVGVGADRESRHFGAAEVTVGLHGNDRNGAVAVVGDEHLRARRVHRDVRRPVAA